jgi:hypothetical protein
MTTATADLTSALITLAARGLRTHCSDPTLSELWVSDYETERAEAVLLCRGCLVIIECRTAADARDERLARMGRTRLHTQTTNKTGSLGARDNFVGVSPRLIWIPPPRSGHPGARPSAFCSVSARGPIAGSTVTRITKKRESNASLTPSYGSKGARVRPLLPTLRAEPLRPATNQSPYRRPTQKKARKTPVFVGRAS